MTNSIDRKTRRKIADELLHRKIWYHGVLNEVDFLNRIFNLSELPSYDGRFANAEGDIWQHVINNNDWEYDWIYSDTRINLLSCPD